MSFTISEKLGGQYRTYLFARPGWCSSNFVFFFFSFVLFSLFNLPYLSLPLFPHLPLLLPLLLPPLKFSFSFFQLVSFSHFSTYFSSRSFLDATTHLYKRSCPSVRPSVRPSVGLSVRRSVPCYFRTTNMANFEDKKSSNDVINNDTISDDEVVASYVPTQYLFPLYSPVLCCSVVSSIIDTRILISLLDCFSFDTEHTNISHFSGSTMSSSVSSTTMIDRPSVAIHPFPPLVGIGFDGQWVLHLLRYTLSFHVSLCLNQFITFFCLN